MDQQTSDKVVKELDSVAQNAHMLTGAFLVFGFIVFHHAPWLFYAIPAYTALTAFKEFYWDQKFEIAEIRGSNLKDFIFYQVGWVGALILYFVSTFVN